MCVCLREEVCAMKSYRLLAFAMAIGLGSVIALTNCGESQHPFSSDTGTQIEIPARPALPPGIEVAPAYRVATGRPGEWVTVFVFYERGGEAAYTSACVDKPKLRTLDSEHRRHQGTDGFRCPELPHIGPFRGVQLVVEDHPTLFCGGQNCWCGPNGFHLGRG